MKTDANQQVQKASTNASVEAAKKDSVTVSQPSSAPATPSAAAQPKQAKKKAQAKPKGANLKLIKLCSEASYVYAFITCTLYFSLCCRNKGR